MCESSVPGVKKGLLDKGQKTYQTYPELAAYSPYIQDGGGEECKQVMWDKEDAAMATEEGSLYYSDRLMGESHPMYKSTMKR